MLELVYIVCLVSLMLTYILSREHKIVDTYKVYTNPDFRKMRT